MKSEPNKNSYRLPIKLFAFAVTVVLFAAPPVRADILVMLDYWWLKDYAKSSCEQGRPDIVPALLIPCSNPDAYINEFTEKLETQFSVTSLCHGITFIAFGGPGKTSDAATSQLAGRLHWALIIDFVPGRKTQEWGLQNSEDAMKFFEGRGTPKEITADVCSALSDRGGSVVR